MPAELLITIGLPSQLEKAIQGDYLYGRPESRCVLVGRSNVGKSSLLNALLQKKNLAYVSQSPGKTKLIHCFWSPELKKVVVDLPGYGYAKITREEQKKWGTLVTAYFDADPRISHFILLLDSRHGPTPVDIETMQYFQHARQNAVIVMTKCDQLRGQSQKFQRKRDVTTALKKLGWGDAPIFWVSVETQEGLDELRRALEAEEAP